MRLVVFHVSFIRIIASPPSFPAPSLSSSQVRKLLLKDKQKTIFYFSGKNSVMFLQLSFERELKIYLLLIKRPRNGLPKKFIHVHNHQMFKFLHIRSFREVLTHQRILFIPYACMYITIELLVHKSSFRYFNTRNTSMNYKLILF